MNHTFIKVLTDGPHVGIGEAYRVGPHDLMVESVLQFKDWLVGHDPTRIEHLWRLMYNGARYPGGSVLNGAISGIEIALWDLKGKILGVPVYQLLGGRCRDKVRVYRGINNADDAKRAVEVEGFTAVKTGPFGDGGDFIPWNQVLKVAAQKMEALRKAVGDKIDIGLDPHARTHEPFHAWQLCEAVQPYNPL